MTETSFEELRARATPGTFVPISKEVTADQLTPVSAFRRVAEYAGNAFLLESVEGGERLARYSFLGKDPFMVLRARGGRTQVDRGGLTEQRPAPLMDTLRAVLADCRSPSVAGLPRFTGGAVGFMGYEAAGWFEPSLERVWNTAYGQQRGADSEDAVFMLFDTILAFDHVRQRILIIANVAVGDGGDLRVQYDFARAKMRFLERELERNLSQPEPAAAGGRMEVRSNMTREAFEQRVLQAQDYIRAGDIYQVVLSQRFETDVTVDPFTVYLKLRHVNPSPYMYFIKMGPRAIVGSSPEMLVRVEDDRAETHPIAGTRPRGETAEDDAALAADLQHDEKECAEHVMLVDLGRNDLGRVCDFGTVRVPTYMSIERYSHVMHLVSRVEGRLAAGRDRLDALAACFPAGTVSGAPKIRAMEIIAELEANARGTYAGAIGYLGFTGHLDCCITIRTILMEKGKAYVQAGAGIVADSVPASEYQETRDKASALLRALELAQGGGGPGRMGMG